MRSTDVLISPSQRKRHSPPLFHFSGTYQKDRFPSSATAGGIPEDGSDAHPEGVKGILSPAMDILVSSSAEAPSNHLEDPSTAANENVKCWLSDLKSEGGFTVPEAVFLKAERENLKVRKVVTKKLSRLLKNIYRTAVAKPFSSVPKCDSPTSRYSAQTPRKNKPKGYILGSHSAVGICAMQGTHSRSYAGNDSKKTLYISCMTAYPAKFANAVDFAVEDEEGYGF